MGDQLLVRAYNVGCGDCTYIRIPGPNDGFHILIDCGKKGGDELLRKAVAHLEAELPKGQTRGKKRLDLIVATHRHEDHIKGFNPKWFANIEVRNIWLSVGMDPKHPQARGIKDLRAFVTDAMRALTAGSHGLSPEVELLASMYGVRNDVADDLLMEKLPRANGIKPWYVHAGLRHSLNLPPETKIHILAPEKDVDHFYLGKELDTTLKGFRALNAALYLSESAPPPTAASQPSNISASQFRVLRSRMLSNGLAFAAKESSIQNNLSVVLLIEWKKRRLLFVGDAEWAGPFREGKQNGSWNVMWEKYRTTHLKAPLDFLKVGHHGSINATPPPAETRSKSTRASIRDIHAALDALLPVPAAGAKATAKAIVSTERDFYESIPHCPLLVDVGRRVSNTRAYGECFRASGIDPKSIWGTAKAKAYGFFENYEKEFLNAPQPWRTDLEFALDGRDFLDIELSPGRSAR